MHHNCKNSIPSQLVTPTALQSALGALQRDNSRGQALTYPALGARQRRTSIGIAGQIDSGLIGKP